MDELGPDIGAVVVGDVAATSGRPLMPLDLSHVVRAERRIRGAVVSTPQDVSWVLSEHLGVPTVVKAEYLQRGGSFKVRGAFNAVAVAVERERPAGVVAGSSGNFGYAVALAARANGLGAAIILAQDTPAFKRRMIEACGASVVEYDRYAEDRVDVVRRAAAERGWTAISGNDNPDVVAGQGTVALELLGAMRDLDVLVLPVGSGSLLAGAAVVAGSLWPDGRLVGVEPVAADDARRSMEAGHRLSVPTRPTVADGLQSQLSDLTWNTIRGSTATVVVVTDEQILSAQRFALERLKIVLETSASTALAALLERCIPLEHGERVALVLTGGNAEVEAKKR